jgi:hypothetical protein
MVNKDSSEYAQITEFNLDYLGTGFNPRFFSGLASFF